MSSQTTVFKLEADRIEETLKEQRQQLRANPDRVLELKIEAAEERVRILQKQDDHHTRVAAEREAAAVARERDARAALEAKLKQTYMQAAPGTTDAEATAALPDLLHRHRIAEQERLNEALAQTKRRIGRI